MAAVADPGQSPGPVGWQPLVLAQAFALGGGFHKKSTLVESMTVADSPNEIQHYVRMDKNSEWLLKAAIGANAQKGALKHCRTFDVIRRQLLAKQNVEGGANADADDPMNEVQDEPAAATRGTKRKRLVDHVCTVEMPAVAGSAFPLLREPREVRVYPKGAQGRSQLWVRDKDVPWLVEYVAHEASTGGVPPLPPADAVAEPNAAGGNVRIRWDFQSGDAWEATFVAGPRRGQQVRSEVSALNETKWNAVRSRFAPEAILEVATPEQRREAVWHYLELHCERAIAADAAGTA
jgi:hypothetical protein